MHVSFDRKTGPRRALALAAAAVALALAMPAAADTTVTCESKDGKRVSCAADTSKGVTLSKQLSTEGCWENENWGTDSKGIWVADYCRAEFTVNADAKKDEDKGGGKKKLLIGGAATAAVVTAIAVSGDDSDDDDNDRGYSYDGDGDIIRCESSKDRRTTCNIGEHRRVELARQLSEADCRKAATWGTTSTTIWVDNGCRGDFRVTYGDRNTEVRRNQQIDTQRAKDKANKVKANKGGAQ